VLIRGGSCVVDPLGNVLVEPVFDGELTHLVDLDRRLIARGKFDFDVAGHYARPDVFKLNVDVRAKSPIAFAGEP
jgi:nitrilase